MIDAIGQWLPICRVTSNEPDLDNGVHFLLGDGWMEFGFRDAASLSSWIIFDVQGRKLAEGNTREKRVNIDRTSLPQGLKILQVEDGKGRILRRNFY